MIIKANINHINDIMNIVNKVVEEMKNDNNDQWDENYPRKENFENDIKNQHLYVDIKDGSIRGFVCLNQEEAPEYNNLIWNKKEDAVVIHRLAVNSSYRNSGIASNLIKFAETLAKENNINYIKTDTYSLNKKMNSLFMKIGYNQLGKIYFGDKTNHFYCYEKLL